MLAPQRGLIANAKRKSYEHLLMLTVDLTVALSYLDLLAPVMGLGTCWAGLLQKAILYSPSLKESLGVPPAHRYHYPMMLGYPNVKFYRLPERKPPKITFK